MIVVPSSKKYWLERTFDLYLNSPVSYEWIRLMKIPSLPELGNRVVFHAWEELLSTQQLKQIYQVLEQPHL